MRSLKVLISVLCFVSMALFSTTSLANSEWGKGGSLTTASTGGTYYVWGGGFSELISSEFSDYSITVEETGGPVHNIKLVNADRADFGLVSMPAAHDAITGERWADGEKHEDFRVLFPMYPSFATIWALEKHGIETVHDLEGKVINLAPTGGTPDTYYRIMLDILDIEPRKIVNSSFSDLVGQMKDGMIHAGAGTGGSPFGPAQETAATHDINLVKFSEGDRDKIINELPSWFKGSIKKEGFECLDEDHPTLQYWNIFIANKNIPEDLAYKITKVFFENQNRFEDVYAPTLKTNPEDIKRSVIPVHPGAARYYEEIGVEIPNNLKN